MARPRRRGRVVTPERRQVLQRVATLVPRLDRPVLVAVDGGDGSGKTVLADDLAGLLVPSVRASLDDFHHPRAHRHACGRTGETVWERGFDYGAVRRELLDPWRRGSGSAYRRRWHDLASDALVDSAEAPPEPVPENGILVVDGVFAQRPELAGVWDVVVYLEVPDDVRVARMAVRDGASPHSGDPDQRRYLDAQEIYHARCVPRDTADVVVDNTDPDRPRLLREPAAGGLTEMPPAGRSHGNMSV